MVAIFQILADGIGSVMILIHRIHRRWLEMSQGMRQRHSEFPKESLPRLGMLKNHPQDWWFRSFGQNSMEIQWRQILLTLQKKKGRKNWLKIVHHSHQYVAVCLNKKSGSLAMTKGQLISERQLCVFKSPKKRTFFVRISAIASNWSNPWNFHTKILSISRAGKHLLLFFWLSGFSIKILCPVGCLSLAFLNWDSQQGRDLATSGGNIFFFNWTNLILVSDLL